MLREPRMSGWLHTGSRCNVLKNAPFTRKLTVRSSFELVAPVIHTSCSPHHTVSLEGEQGIGGVRAAEYSPNTKGKPPNQALFVWSMSALMVPERKQKLKCIQSYNEGREMCKVQLCWVHFSTKISE